MEGSVFRISPLVKILIAAGILCNDFEIKAPFTITSERFSLEGINEIVKLELELGIPSYFAERYPSAESSNEKLLLLTSISKTPSESEKTKTSESLSKIFTFSIGLEVDASIILPFTICADTSAKLNSKTETKINLFNSQFFIPQKFSRSH